MGEKPDSWAQSSLTGLKIWEEKAPRNGRGLRVRLPDNNPSEPAEPILYDPDA
jgi:hypothetical protein